MKEIVRTIFGLGFGWLAAGLLGLVAHAQSAVGMGRRTQRRTFVRNAALGATGAVGAISTVGVLALVWPNKTGEFGRELTVPADSVPPMNGAPFRHVQGKFFLVHSQDGLLALYTKCPHLGCTVPWVGPAESPQAFQCPCHGSMYNYVGERTGGPAPRPMDYMPITVDGTNVRVDTGDIQTRAAYDPSQAVPYA